MTFDVEMMRALQDERHARGSHRANYELRWQQAEYALGEALAEVERLRGVINRRVRRAMDLLEEHERLQKENAALREQVINLGGKESRR